MTETAIGRVKTVLVPPEGQAIITAILARPAGKLNSARLTYQGEINFVDSVQRHLQEDVLPHLDAIVQQLELPNSSFTLTAVNIGAAASSGIGISVTGFSSDLSVFLACLSCALNLPIRQDILFTGHIGSCQGDILPVARLAAKCQAAVLQPDIKQLVYPSLESDMSMRQLKPNEYAAATAAVRGCRGKLKMHAVVNTLEVVEKALEPQAIVLASLRRGFYDAPADQVQKSQHSSLAAYLSTDNHERFWQALEENLLLKNVKNAHELMTAFAQYHIARAKYPSLFGQNLSRLIISLPSQIRRRPELMPLLAKDRYIALIQAALAQDYGDISLLHDALYADLPPDVLPNKSSKKRKQKPADDDALLRHILEQLSPEFIESRVTRPYDDARARYATDRIIVASNQEFLGAVTAFYTHISRHALTMPGPVDKNSLGAEALDALKRTFRGKNGYNEALAEARAGQRGGLRYIMDAITEQLKQEAREKHVLKTFKENIDPLDFAAKTRIITALLQRAGHDLPEQITCQPPERYAQDYEEIVQAFVQAKSSFESLLRRL